MPDTVSATEARVHFGAIMRRVVETQEAVVVEKSGKPQVAIVPEALLRRFREGGAREVRRLALERLLERNAKIRERLARTGTTWPAPEDVVRQSREERSDDLFGCLSGGMPDPGCASG